MSSGISFSLFTMGCVATLLAYIFIERIQNMYFVTSVAAIVCVVIFTLLPESPYFYFSQYRLAEAHEALMRIGRVNDPNQQVFFDTKISEMLEKMSTHKKTQDKQLSILSRHPEVMIRIPLICLIFLNICVGYYLSNLVTQSIGRWSIYTNGILLELSEFMAYMVVVVFANRLKRRTVNIAVSSGILGLAGLLLLIEFLPGVKNHWATNAVQTILSVLIKFIIGINFALVYNYTSELLPTGIRGRGLGIAGVFNKMGGVAASFFEDASKQLGIHPMIFSGTFAIFAIPAAIALPETLNQEVPE